MKIKFSSLKYFAAGIAIAAMLTSCNNPLPKGNWEKNNWKTLSTLIKENGKKSKGYDDKCRPYAVFDFDNTSIMNDVEMSTMAYQIEHLWFRITPDNMFVTLAGAVPDIDMPLSGLSAEVTSRMLIEDICDEYKYLYDKYISLYESPASDGAEKALKTVRKSSEFKNFRAKTWALSEGVNNTFDYGTACLWPLRLFNGMTEDEVKSLVKEAVSHYTSMKKIKKVQWESEDSGRAGKITVTRAEGIGIAKEMTQLYNALMDNGFDVYICSASMETVVETLACDSKYGFKISPDNVFGIRLTDNGSGTIDAVYSKDYEQPFQAGKVRAITKYIAPSHGGKGPVLVAGDSNGDINMLTEFKDLKVGLILNCHNGGLIGTLSQYAMFGKDVLSEDPLMIANEDAKYILQGRDYAKKRFNKSNTSKALK